MDKHVSIIIALFSVECYNNSSGVGGAENNSLVLVLYTKHYGIVELLYCWVTIGYYWLCTFNSLIDKLSILMCFLLLWKQIE